MSRAGSGRGGRSLGRRLTRHALGPAIACAIGCALPAHADVRLDPVLGTGAVIQRDRAIVLRGSSDPGERIVVRLGDATRTVVADAAGRWRAELPAAPAGGPYRLTATGARTSAVADDILIGDVWLCSGQSNMAMPVQRALNAPTELAASPDPQLRLMTVPQDYSPSPRRDIGDVRWRAADADSVAPFSAACYFMARDLRRSQKVPIGAINASWGGTQIRPWLAPAAAGDLPGAGDDLALLALHDRDPAAASAAFGRRWEAWWRGTTAERQGEEPWRSPDRLSWQPVPRIGPWETWGVERLNPFAGMIWFRRTVTLTPEQAHAGAVLDLGVIEDMDVAWVNGVVVGTGYGPTVSRRYAVPPGQLRAGPNDIVVNVLNAAGSGGFQSAADAVRLTFADGTAMPLATGWTYAVHAAGDVPIAPRTPWESRAGFGTIYNAMIAPLGGMRLAGVAWYQGESDTRLPGYAARLAALVRGWRGQFAAPELPFLIVSLAGFGPSAATPQASGRADVREAQRRVAAGDPHAALVATIDLGEEGDIHPANKQDVGRRLARAARALAYRDRGTPSGPRVIDAVRSPGAVIVRLADVTGALEARSASEPIGFQLCGPTQESCRWARATIDGGSVRLTDDGRPASRIRYAWGDSPIVNLYDQAGLPLGPFEVGINRPGAGSDGARR